MTRTRARDLSARGFFDPDQDTQQRRLADAVGTDQRQPRALRDRKRNTREQFVRAEGFGEGGDSDEGHESVRSVKCEVMCNS